MAHALIGLILALNIGIVHSKQSCTTQIHTLVKNRNIAMQLQSKTWRCPKNACCRVNSLLSLRAAPVIPTLGNNYVIHVSIDVDCSGIGPPCSAQVNLTRSCNLAVNEHKSRVFVVGGPFLRCERAWNHWFLSHCVKLTTLPKKIRLVSIWDRVVLNLWKHQDLMVRI